MLMRQSKSAKPVSGGDTAISRVTPPPLRQGIAGRLAARNIDRGGFIR
jgi:hypothetical protein